MVNKKRPIMIYSTDRRLSGRFLYFEMSSHPERGNITQSIKISE
jgi:hypothetical protein